jgi:L-fucose mutarotase
VSAQVLKGLDPLLGPDLLHALASMGHGDELVVADANFPAATLARRLIELSGVGAPDAARAILSVLPLDSFVAEPALVMEVVGNPTEAPPVVAEFERVVGAAAGRPVTLGRLARAAFYTRAQHAFAIVRTGERRLYGNLILVKGVVAP